MRSRRQRIMFSCISSVSLSGLGLQILLVCVFFISLEPTSEISIVGSGMVAHSLQPKASYREHCQLECLVQHGTALPSDSEHLLTPPNGGVRALHMQVLLFSGDFPVCLTC